MKAQKPFSLKKTYAKFVELHAASGTLFSDCIREGIIIASIYHCDVTVNHNGRVYTISQLKIRRFIDDIMTDIKK